MTIKIFGRKSSCNVQKVIWFCSEANISFETVDYGGKHGKTKEDFFKSKNPNSTVPVIDDNGFILYESNAIIRYLSNKYNILKLKNNEQNALTDQWMDWASFTLAAPCATVTLNSLLLPLEKRDPEKILKAKNQVLSLLKILDVQLLKNEFIIGDNFSLADIPAGCWYNRCVKLDFELSDYKGITSWGLRLAEREAFQKSIVLATLPQN